MSFFLSVFSLFWKENFLMGPKKKHLGFTIYFPSFPPNQTHSKKIFILIFLQNFPSTLFYLQTNTKIPLHKLISATNCKVNFSH